MFQPRRLRTRKPRSVDTSARNLVPLHFIEPIAARRDGAGSRESSVVGGAPQVPPPPEPSARKRYRSAMTALPKFSSPMIMLPEPRS